MTEAEMIAELDDETRAVCAAWFSILEPDYGSLSFGMKDIRPTARAQVALDRLQEKAIIKRVDHEDGSVYYIPLIDCYSAQEWFITVCEDDRFSFSLTEKIHPDAKLGHTMIFSSRSRR